VPEFANAFVERGPQLTGIADVGLAGDDLAAVLLDQSGTA
jgi:hypothetical protein